VPTHIVKPGECVASLAAKCGTTLQSIWEDPANAALKERRASPYVLAPGDAIELPEPNHPERSVEPAGQHRLEARVGTVRLRLALIDEQWGNDRVVPTRERTEHGYRTREGDPVSVADVAPLARVAFRLEVGGQHIEGTTDGDGVLDEPVDARATAALLVIEPDTPRERRMALHIGYLDPIDEHGGAVQRLRNLGFGGAAEGPELDDAIAAFQQKQGLEVTGELDEATRNALLEKSGG